MEFTEINKTDSHEFAEAMKIYEEAFPANERHAVNVIGERVSKGLSTLYTGSSDNEIAFIALLWPLKETDFILLDYIATKDAHRGKGIASAFLEKLRTDLLNSAKHLILEVERPEVGDNSGEKEKRVMFYKRRGAKVMDGVRYLLPPLAGGEPTEMILMLFPESKNESISSTVVKNLITQMYRELYGRPEDDALLGTFVHDVGNPIKLI